MTAPGARKPDALTRAILRQHPELAGHVHLVNGRPWCDGINHTLMCSADFEAPAPVAVPGITPAVADPPCWAPEHYFMAESDGARVCQICGEVESRPRNRDRKAGE